MMGELTKRILVYAPQLHAASSVLAELDCVISLAACARDYNLSRPQLTPDNIIKIKNGTATSLVTLWQGLQFKAHNTAHHTTARHSTAQLLEDDQKSSRCPVCPQDPLHHANIPTYNVLYVGAWFILSRMDLRRGVKDHHTGTHPHWVCGDHSWEITVESSRQYYIGRKAADEMSRPTTCEEGIWLTDD